jgi:hypothetical protein
LLHVNPPLHCVDTQLLNLKLHSIFKYNSPYFKSQQKKLASNNKMVLASQIYIWHLTFRIGDTTVQPYFINPSDEALNHFTDF